MTKFSIHPPDFNFEADLFEGTFEVEVKSLKKRVRYMHGFADFTEHVGAGLPERLTKQAGVKLEVRVPIQHGLVKDSSAKEIRLAWKESGLLEKATEKELMQLEDYTWHHTIDISNGEVKMQLVPKILHNTTEDGVAHTGGAAVIEFLKEAGISF